MANKKQTKKRNPVFVKLVLLILGIATLFFIFVSGPRGTWKLYQSDQEKQQLIKDIELLEAKKAEMDSERTRLLNDPDYIEKVAREEYNMKKKGEKVYRIENESDN